MQGIVLIRDLAIVLTAAALAAWVCQRVGLSVVVGYLLAGAVVGPFGGPVSLVGNSEQVQVLAQVGLVFLIFSIGLNLGLSRLKRLGASVIIATFISAILVLNGARIFGWAIGWSVTASLFLAGMLMVSSSAIIGKLLDEANLSHERGGQLALGVTIAEDVVAITMLTLLASLARFGQAESVPLLPTVLALGAFVVFVLFLSILFVPNLLSQVSREAHPEIRTLIVAGILLALSWLAVQVGYSLALGAFIFGAIVGSTRFKSDIEAIFQGTHQLFGAVFFVAVGMMVDLRLLLGSWPLVLGVAALALVLRPLACLLGLIAVGNSRRESIQAALSLTPLGEFTFVIAQLGVETGVLPRTGYPVAAGAALLTALAAPVFTRNAETISARLVQLELPLVSRWIGFYDDWLMRLRRRQTASVVWRLTSKRFLQTGLQVLFISALLLFVRPVYESAREGFEGEGPWSRLLPFAFWTVFGIVLLAPLIAIWRNVSALAMILAEAATAGAHRHRMLRTLLERVLRLIALLVLASWMTALLPTGWSLLGVAGLVLLVLTLVAAVFWRRFVKLHSRLEIELREQLNRASQVTSASAWSDTLPLQSGDWDVDIDEVTLPADSLHAGKTLGELALRPRFGCSVAGIDRQGFSIVNPDARTVLYPHDKLLLLGGREPLARAGRELLSPAAAGNGPTGFDELTMETLKVPPGSPLAGRPLLDLDLIRKTGAQIGAIRNASRSILAPTGRDTFQPGDELLVLGTSQQIRELGRLLDPGG